MKIIATFSGGKDSLAATLWMLNNGYKKFDTIFCDTGWESDITYKHIKEVDKRLGLNLTTLKSKEFDGMIDMVRRKTRFPSTRRRFCTSELKVKPMIDYILAAETLEFFEKSFTSLNAKTTGFESININQAIKQAVSKAETAQKEFQQGKVVAIPTHLEGLDKVFEGGWRAPDLIILGGRPSMGKTQHSLAIAMSAANANLDCLFVSIEMTAVQLVNRLILESDAISSYNLRTGQMKPDEWDALDHQIGKLSTSALHIADNHNIRYLNNIKTEARRLHRQGKLRLLIIDYLQLIKTNIKFERRQLEVAYITGELKALAKELEIPIIALSQLSRTPKGSVVKEPDLEDLREAGDIEQDADIVLFIHKPHYYNPELTEWENRGMLLIRKSREGARNEGVQFAHDSRYKKIFDTDFVITTNNPF